MSANTHELRVKNYLKQLLWEEIVFDTTHSLLVLRIPPKNLRNSSKWEINYLSSSRTFTGILAPKFYPVIHLEYFYLVVFGKNGPLTGSPTKRTLRFQ